MKLYRVDEGVVVEDGSGAYLIEDDWDELLNRGDLFKYLRARVRRDSRWNVPEPELALAVTRTGRIVGYTVGNDMSSRDIEGENPLYLPQAKVYDRSCALTSNPSAHSSTPSSSHRTRSSSMMSELYGRSIIAGAAVGE